MKTAFVISRQSLLVMLVATCCSGSLSADDGVDKTTNWHGFDQQHFSVVGQSAYVVIPKSPADGKPWIWRARFPGYHFEMDVELVKRGFHVGYVDVGGLYGSPQAMKIAEAFYDIVTSHQGLNARPVMEGVSRGGLVVYNWAVKHPQKVACIYCDTPVLDIRSWPGGQGAGKGSPTDWNRCLSVYELSDQQVAEYQGPLAQVAQIATQKIPILHIVSEDDQVVPPLENTYRLRDLLRESGHDMTVISVPNGTKQTQGHHFTHPEPDTVVQFIMKHGSVEN